MKKLTFKNYPPSILAILVCIIIALNFGFKALWQTFGEHKSIGIWEEIVWILLSYSIVRGTLSIVNRHCRWKWLYHLLDIADVTGNYIGTITSSYYVDDDTTKAHIKLFCKVQILQNINALRLKGGFYTDQNFKNQSSEFHSYWEEIKKKDNGDYIITYFFSNKKRALHPDDKKYNLTNHDGVGVLTYSPLNRNFQGYYFNHERFSNGEISLELLSEIIT